MRPSLPEPGLISLAFAGESVPVTKTSLPHADHATPWKRHSMEDYRRHVLFCGTEVIQTRRAGAGPASAVVLQTGELGGSHNRHRHI